ncbi:MAG TPA: FG-GAP-like repeat-containing protein, partial [Planctomycetota bacterium]|nr:FG-GAP-like repeat-containing protein [Planctomycetota bacterium]
MIPRSRRWGLAAALGVLAAVSVLFYQRQNAGLNTGGPISAPKMLWLARALAAWFILPAFLAWDGRLDAAVRRLFKAFWVVMMARGVVELVLIYSVGHWNPLYGIAHNAFCMLLIWVLCLRAAPRGVWDRRALRVAGSLLVSLTAEISFAGMFYLTGAHENGVYFASTEAAWGFINLVTLLVLLFVIPDLAAALVTLYFPGVSRETPRVLRWGRRGGCVATACVALGALALWTRMHLHEAEARRFQETGYRIVDSCMRFKDDFTRGSGSHFRDAARERGITFRMEQDERFVPCGSCDRHACFGPSRLKFQTMRHAYAGCSAADYDGDGHDDVFFCAGGRSALFRNRGDGTFEEATRNAGLGEIWHV